ncbi:MFS transporter [Phycicoccus sp. CSK15P-2]|uniref:MFS transporter n=1 Tax=Phycicoccus sp. CSK15P-2 TaxID=2807627 RepID=UPI00194F8CA2|nr:MFS transporter [Phycicoccus sp. CSK15P-2]MBM6405156.1 MFS transporter [Phycicoccus sp. CSK15P-2]
MTTAGTEHVGGEKRPRTGRVTLLVALAVFAQESTWNFYDNQVPPLLREHLASAALVGLFMGMDNLLGIFVQPWLGSRSDNTRTRWGRRIPYLVVGMPVAAVLFLLIPHAAATLPTLILTMFSYALVANAFKPIAEALLPDFIEPDRRSRANAAVKIASGLTVIVAASISLLVVDEHPYLAFAIPSGLMVMAVVVLASRLRETRSTGYQTALADDSAFAAREGGQNLGQGRHAGPVGTRVRDTLVDIVGDPDRSRLSMMLAIFVFAGAWFSSRSLMTPFGQEALGLSRGDAGGLTLPSGLAFLLAVYPAALLAERYGRFVVIMAGMGVFAGALVLGTVLDSSTGVVVALCIGAAGAAGFMVNAVVVLWNLAPSVRVVGTYSGLYTVGWMSGGFLGPALVGGLVDLLGWRWMLLDIAALAVISIAIVARVRRHHRHPDEQSADERSASDRVAEERTT